MGLLHRERGGGATTPTLGTSGSHSAFRAGPNDFTAGLCSTH